MRQFVWMKKIRNMRQNTTTYHYDFGQKNTEECKYYKGSGSWYDPYDMKRVCSSVSNNFVISITLGGVVLFSSGIMQIVTSDKPICGLAFSIIALLFIMQPTVSIAIDSSNQYKPLLMFGECLCIPLASVIYCLQQYELKKPTSSPPEKTDVVV